MSARTALLIRWGSSRPLAWGRGAGRWFTLHCARAEYHRPSGGSAAPAMHPQNSVAAPWSVGPKCQMKEGLMRHSTRVLVGLLAVLSVAAGCTSATTRTGRVSQLPPEKKEVPVGTLQPIPGHPPITASGVVEAYNQTNGHLIFKDGRVVQLTNMTTVSGVGPATGFRRGETVVVDNVLPVGVFTVMPAAGAAYDPAMMGKNRLHQRMATVRRVDTANGFVLLTNDSIVRVSPETKVHMGAAGPTLVLTDVRPGDQIVFVTVEPPTEDSPSALPRQTQTRTLQPVETTEIMIFRVQQ